MGATVNKSWRTTLSAIVLAVLLVGSLLLLVSAVLDSATFERHLLTIFSFNIILFLVLVVLLIVNLGKLVSHRIKKKTGARVTLRLVIFFSLFAALPAVGIYSVSAWMIDRGMQSWFSVGVEQALEDALSLSRYSLDTQLQLHQSYIAKLVENLDEAPDDLARYLLGSYAQEHPISELVLFTADKKIISAVGGRNASLLPDLPSGDLLRQAIQERGYFGVDPIQKRGLYIRIIAPIRSNVIGQGHFLQVLHPLSERANTWAVSVQETYQHYARIAYFRGLLQTNFLLVLTLVLLLGIIYAGWVAIIAARNLIRPLAELTDATQNISQGDLNVRITTSSKDEVGQLVESFNEMAQNLSEAHFASVQSKQLLEEQNSYLDTVLRNISSGVLGLAKSGVLKTANPVASKILGSDWESHVGAKLFSLSGDQTIQQKFCTQIEAKMQESYSEWEAQININAMGRYLSLLCRGKALADGEYVIVFNDITQVEQAQRETVWGEVAQRLAHEIKNPLTPIQLSAELLKKKLGKTTLSKQEMQWVDRSTHTIIEQVKAMKQMVDEFSQYARPAHLHLEVLSLSAIVREVTDLYRGSSMIVSLNIPSQDIYMLGSVSQLRQLLHNLLKNAEEAMHDVEESKAVITVETHSEDKSKITLRVEDCGPGFAQNVIKNLFEPYATTKQKGKGLGLAIVKKIAEEHKGTIQASNGEQGGAVIAINFPQIKQ